MGWRFTVDPIARQFGFYTAYTLRESEFVGRLGPEAPVWLRTEAGYETPPTLAGIKLEAAKRDPEGDPYAGGVRKVDPENRSWQYHVHLFREGEQYRVASHRELRPDIEALPGESLGDVRDRLRTHYDPDTDDYLRGETCDVLADRLDENESN